MHFDTLLVRDFSETPSGIRVSKVDGLRGASGCCVLTDGEPYVMLAAVWPSDNSVTERKNRAEDKIENK